MNSIFRLPFHNRYSELTEYIDKSPVKDLEILYPKLIAEIFNSSAQVNWGLRTLKADTSYNAFYAVLNFLSPNGPIFRLCYKLLLDCHLWYEFPYQYLPSIVRKRFEDGSDSSFYKQKLVARSKTKAGNFIYLNAFEYYMFHFAYHLINPSLQLVDDVSEWDTVYLRLVEAYLDHFVPCTTSLVYPILNQSSSPISSAQSNVTSFSSTTKSSISLFREDVLKKMSPTPPPFTRSKANASVEIWRSELVATLFLDFWLSCSYNDFGKTLSSFSAQNSWSIEMLPSKEQLRCTRLLLRHLHYFSNHLLPEDCAMNDLKREILSSSRSTIYSFFWSTMMHLPLDSSYRLLLEAWFTYIQPWRYTNPYFKSMKFRENREGIERKWFPFIAENLIMYTHLYFVVLTRLSRCDLTTFKISSMSYRLMQVFSQPQFLEYVTEVEDYLEEGRLRSINRWNSIIRQNIYSMEKTDYRYDFFFSQNHTLQALEFIKQIEENIPTLQLRRAQIQAEENVSFVKWLKEQLSGDVRYSSLEEIKNIEYYLTHSVQKLYAIHKIPPSDLQSNTSFMSNVRNNAGDAYSSFSSFDSSDGISNYSTASLSVDPKEKRKAALSFTYEGDPDLYPIRSWESKFLVRVFYFICLWLNTQFHRDLKRLYYEDSILGGIARQILCPPQWTFHFDKSSSPDGYSRRVSTLLAPRISLRKCASYYFTFLVLLFYLFAKFFQFNTMKFGFVIFSVFCLYLLISSIFHPVPIPEDENTLSSPR